MKKKQPQLDAKDAVAVKEAIAMLRGDFPVSSVTLFGSKAVGNSDAESDIDLLVLTTVEPDWKMRDAMSDRLFDIGLKHDVVFSILAVSEQEWRDGVITVLPIYHEIKEHGITL